MEEPSVEEDVEFVPVILQKKNSCKKLYLTLYLKKKLISIFVW